MTREEAIEKLEQMIKWGDPYEVDEDACKVAIKALRQETKTDVLDKIRAEIDSYCSDNRDRNDGLYIAMKIIDKYMGDKE